jgi:hypothetical protein
MFPFDADWLEDIVFYITIAYTAGFLVLAGVIAYLIKKYVINRE